MAGTILRFIVVGIPAGSILGMTFYVCVTELGVWGWVIVGWLCAFIALCYVSRNDPVSMDF